jgi:hypothetical protein
MSSIVSTRVARSAPNPAKAMAVRSIFSVPAVTHPATISTNATATIFSSRDSGPIERRALRAAAGASGVPRTPGGNNQYSTSGRSSTVASAGTEAAKSHEPKLIFTSKWRAISTPIGFTEVAVSQRAEETARLAMPQNMR